MSVRHPACINPPIHSPEVLKDEIFHSSVCGRQAHLCPRGLLKTQLVLPSAAGTQILQKEKLWLREVKPLAQDTAVLR